MSNYFFLHPDLSIWYFHIHHKIPSPYSELTLSVQLLTFASLHEYAPEERKPAHHLGLVVQVYLVLPIGELIFSGHQENYFVIHNTFNEFSFPTYSANFTSASRILSTIRCCSDNGGIGIKIVPNLSPEI